MSRSKIIQDNSHYQQFIDFKLMKDLGQDYMILKAANGSLHEDSKWEDHYKSAVKENMRIAPYFWVDPIYDAIEQATFFLNLVKEKDIAWIELDWEHYWANWSEWESEQAWMRSNKSTPKPKVQILSSDYIFNHFKTVYEYVNKNTDLPIVVYTAAWFLNSYCPQGYDYLKDKYTHWADYTLFSGIKQKKTWAQLEEMCPIGKAIPTLPKNYPLDKVLMWQFTGDRFTANGVYSDVNKTRLSDLDLNIWVNKNMVINQFDKNSNSIVLPTEEKPMIETFKKSSKFVNVLNVPYVSQLGSGATKHNNDCGAACACSLIGGYKDAIPTVDEFYDKSQSTGDVYLSATQIISTLKKYGISSKWYISDLKKLMEHLSSGKPAICLVLYKTLVDAGIVKSTFKGYHFVLAIGYDTKNIYINDPLYGGEYLEVPIKIFNQCWKDAGIDYKQNPSYGCIIPDSSIGEEDAPAYDKYIVTSTVGLRVRSEPIIQNNPSNIIRVMKYNEVFQVISISNNWGQLVNGGYSDMTYAKKI